MPEPAQIPFMAKQPEVILIPLDKVEVPKSERNEFVPMPRSEETVNLEKVEVAVVEVATKYWAISGWVEVTTLKAFRVLPDQNR
jgi:hypothetical protein